MVSAMLLSVLAATCASASGVSGSLDAAEAALAGPPAISVLADARGAWAFQNAKGERFLSMGIDNVTPRPYQPRPGTDYYNPVPTQFKGDDAAWGAWARGLLLDHGFNTAGGWSAPAVPGGDGLYHTPVLYVSAGERHPCLAALRDDFAELVRENARKELARHKPESLLGVFLDNEMAWWGKTGWDRIPNYTLIERAMEEPAEGPIRQAAIAFLKGRYPTVKALAEAHNLPQPPADWRSIDVELLKQSRGDKASADRRDFTAMVADKYYRVAAAAVREVAPGVLILGTRFAGDAPDAVIAACGAHCDVISFNDYRGPANAPDELIARYWVLGKRPLMITEFSWRGAENNSGNPNTAGAGAVVRTQAERAERYAAYVEATLRSSVIIGLHWFEFADQSPQGRFDGENSNYGVVDIKNQPYPTLLGAMKAAHAKIPSIRAGQLRPAPTELPKPPKITYSPAQRPDRPPAFDLLAGDATRGAEVWNAPDASLNLGRAGTGGKGYTMGYSAGGSYGCGVNIFGPKAAAIAGGESVDLSGYTDFVVEITAPKGVQLNLVLSEAGAGPPGQVAYGSSAGDDGESFISEAFYGTGGRASYKVAIASLSKQAFWGNQSGKNEIQMHAVRNFGVQIQGTPLKGEVTLHEARLER